MPKALIEVAGEPFIFHQLRYLRAQGIEHVVLCIGYLGHMISEMVGTGANFGLRIDFSEDGINPLGTGGALAKAIPLLGDQFFVLYGDSFLPVNFKLIQAAYEQGNQCAMMTVLKNLDQWDKSNVLFVDGQLLEYNKQTPSPAMSHIDYGLGVLASSLFCGLELGQPFDLADFYQTLSCGGQLAGFEVAERFYEIGSYSGLKEAEEYLMGKEIT